MKLFLFYQNQMTSNILWVLILNCMFEQSTNKYLHNYNYCSLNINKQLYSKKITYLYLELINVYISVNPYPLSTCVL